MSELRGDNCFCLKFGLFLILIVYLIGNISVFMHINEIQLEEKPKLIVKGGVLSMDYWNITTEDIIPNFNPISRNKEYLTTYYRNSIILFPIFTVFWKIHLDFTIKVLF